MTITPQLIYALIIGGGLVPNFVAIVIRSHWAGWLKGLVVVASSLIGGALTAWANGQFTGLTVTEDVFAVMAAAVGFYKLFWQPTGITPALERATQPSYVPKQPGQGSLMVQLAKDGAASQRGTD